MSAVEVFFCFLLFAFRFTFVFRLMCCHQNNLRCDHTRPCCVHFLLRVLCSGTHDACRAVVPSDWSLALTSWLPLCRCLCSQRGFPSTVTCCSITHSVNRCVLKRSRHEICWNRHGLLSIIPNPNIMFSSAQFTSQCCFYVNQKLDSDCSCTLLLQVSHVLLSLLCAGAFHTDLLVLCILKVWTDVLYLCFCLVVTFTPELRWFHSKLWLTQSSVLDVTLILGVSQMFGDVKEMTVEEL